ncbi:hypothetical protein L208DRAFT_1404681 [Tricholoma matsutake]|nr:hypothetical protein L208DRAFT_1404681 [Tricholoma matsutake 945]
MTWKGRKLNQVLCRRMQGEWCHGEASEDSDCGEMDEPEFFSESRPLSTTAEQVAFEVDCDIDIKSSQLLDLLTDSPTVTETDVIVSPAPSA